MAHTSRSRMRSARKTLALALTLGFGGVHRSGDLLPWFAGADLGALRESSTDRVFYASLGACTLALCCLNGLMLMIAVSFVTGGGSAWRLWYVAVIWAIIMSSVERLVLQMPAGSAKGLLGVAIPRVALSILLALAISEVATLQIYAPEIRSVLSQQHAQAVRDADKTVQNTYEPKIYAANDDIARLQANQRIVAQRIVRYDLRANTARTTSGACAIRCGYYAGLAQNARLRLQSMADRNRLRIAGDRALIGRLQSEGSALAANRRKAINADSGLLARVDALSTLQTGHGAVTFQVWVIRLLLVVLDLVPMTAKLTRALTLRSAYDKNVEGRRAEESLLGETRLEGARTEQSRVADEGRAARRRNRSRADAQEFTNQTNFTHAADSQSRPPIEGQSLTTFASHMEDWDTRPIRTPEGLLRGGLIGLAAIAVTLVACILLRANGTLLVVATFVAAAGLFAKTRGFRVASATGLRAIFATLVTGMAMPFAVLLLNV